MDWLQVARDIGFEHAEKLNSASLCARDEVRAMCGSGKCRIYGKRWSCPPACGELSVCQKKMDRYCGGIIVQTVSNLEDDFDAEGIALAQARHKLRFETIVRQLRTADKACLPLTAGGCTRCESCTYPGRPCRYPGKMMSSMEAYGLLVSDVCNASGLAYNYGPKTIAFTSCILTDLNLN